VLALLLATFSLLTAHAHAAPGYALLFNGANN
jgi:hypothetical protein